MKIQCEGKGICPFHSCAVLLSLTLSLTVSRAEDAVVHGSRSA